MDLAAAVTVQRARITTVVLCGLLTVLGLMVTIALALSSSNVHGRCLLYADQSDLGPSAACSFIYAVVAIFQLVGCLGRAVLIALVLAGVLTKEEFLTHTSALLGYAIADVIACILTLVSGGLVSHGFSSLCSGVFQPYSDRCSDSEFYVLSSSSFVKDFYSRLNIAQAGVWISFLLWILLVLVDVLLLWKAGVLSDLKGSFGRASSPRGGTGGTNTNSSAAVRGGIWRDKESNQSQRSAAALIFRGQGGGDSDTESGPRTPPPRRPVPPRPAHAAGGGGGASGKPLMEKY